MRGGVRGGEWCVRGMGWVRGGCERVGREGVGCERKGKEGKERGRSMRGTQ